jgi:hypothetical protein
VRRQQAQPAGASAHPRRHGEARDGHASAGRTGGERTAAGASVALLSAEVCRAGMLQSSGCERAKYVLIQYTRKNAGFWESVSTSYFQRSAGRQRVQLLYSTSKISGAARRRRHLLMQNELRCRAPPSAPQPHPAPPGASHQRRVPRVRRARAERALRSAFRVHSGGDPGAAGPELLIFGGQRLRRPLSTS